MSEPRVLTNNSETDSRERTERAAGRRRTPRPLLNAYVLHPDALLPLRPTETDRDWMDRIPGRFAHHCLPLLMANQSGWMVLSAHELRVTWDGGATDRSLTIDYLAGEPPYPAISHFGSGILTWVLPYLFQTSPGWNLLARGPANHVKDGIQALEGLVETDWSPATFTLNWKMTRPHHAVTFARGEPIGMLVPQRRDDLESFRLNLCRLEDDEKLSESLGEWASARARFLVECRIPGTAAYAQRWQGDYFRGRCPDGTRAEQHQTKRSLRPFEDKRGKG